VYDRLAGHDVRAIAPDALQRLGGDLTAEQLRVLAAAAHSASAEWPPDPSTSAPTDTTHISIGGGPC